MLSDTVAGLVKKATLVKPAPAPAVNAEQGN
jgi:hypothetical protein